VSWIYNLARFSYRRAIRLAPRDAVPYATHLPVLVGLSSIVRPKVVVEFGSGTYSTLTFLNRAIFPSLESLISLEDDTAWYEKMKQLVAADKRASLRLVAGSVASRIASIAWSAVDLIFVDDSEERGRSVTLNELSKHISSIPVVLHDYNSPRLRWATRTFERRYFFSIWNPQTCVLWNGNLPWDWHLKTLNAILRSHRKVSVDDTAVWNETLSSFPKAC
jgi:hypothetical protein